MYSTIKFFLYIFFFYILPQSGTEFEDRFRGHRNEGGGREEEGGGGAKCNKPEGGSGYSPSVAVKQ